MTIKVNLKDVKFNKVLNTDHIGLAGDTLPDIEYETESFKDKLKITPIKIFILVAVILSAIFITIGLYFMNLTKANNQKEEATQKVENVSTKEDLKENLEQSTKSINAPTKVTTENLLGNYLLGATTYYPDDPKKLYIDFTIKAPKEKVKQADDETAKKILETFKSTLPKINDTIEVKDASKVTMEIYTDSKIYQTILLYDGKPFAYINTDKNLISTNHITSEYVVSVAKE